MKWRKTKRAAVLARWPVCAYCRQTYCPPSRRFSIDHLIPRSRGGSNELENLVGCCAACNVAKGSRTPEEWLAELAEAVHAIRTMSAPALQKGGAA